MFRNGSANFLYRFLLASVHFPVCPQAFRVAETYTEDSGCPDNVLTTMQTRYRGCKEICFRVQILLSIKISTRTKLPIRKAPNQAEASRTTKRSHQEHAEALPNIKFVVRMLSSYCPGPSGRLFLD